MQLNLSHTLLKAKQKYEYIMTFEKFKIFIKLR